MNKMRWTQKFIRKMLYKLPKKIIYLFCQVFFKIFKNYLKKFALMMRAIFVGI